MKIKKNDNVIVITGKYKGTTGAVVRAFPTLNKIVVEGVNVRKRHIRSGRRDKAGQIVEMPMPINVSNVRLADASAKKEKKEKKEAAPKKAKVANAKK